MMRERRPKIYSGDVLEMPAAMRERPTPSTPKYAKTPLFQIRHLLALSRRYGCAQIVLHRLLRQQPVSAFARIRPCTISRSYISKLKEAQSKFSTPNPDFHFSSPPSTSHSAMAALASTTTSAATVPPAGEITNPVVHPSPRNLELSKDTKNSQIPQPELDLPRQGLTPPPEPTDAAESSTHEAEIPEMENQKTTTPPVDGDSDKNEAPENLQFKKKDLRRLRTQSFQLVLSTASLKLLRQPHGLPPQLQRNGSQLSNSNVNLRNMQSYIQAPVLSSVTNRRLTEDAEIGRHLPFDDGKRASEIDRRTGARLTAQIADSSYRDETTLQQQRLTTNALKKLLLLLAPIIHSEDDASSNLQLTLRPLNEGTPKSRLFNSNAAKMSLDIGDASSTASDAVKPYKPAEVDLLRFSSLTRQSKHLGGGDVGDMPLQRNATESPASEKPSESPSVPSQQLSAERRPDQSRLTISRTMISGSARGAMTPKVEKFDHESGRPHFPSVADSLQNPMGATAPGAPSLLNTLEMHLRGRKVSLQLDDVPKLVPTELRNPQQIKGLRSPLYVPAVLRHTASDFSLPTSANFDTENDYLSAHGQPIPSRDATLSVESMWLANLNRLLELVPGAQDQGAGSAVAASRTGPYMLLNGGKFSSINGVVKASQSFHAQSGYDRHARAPPTRKHWLKDEQVNQCGIPQCQRTFNFFERRHHCRKCGGIFCKEHTLHYLYISHMAQFTTGGRGTLLRVCDNCIREYNDFMRHEFGGARDDFKKDRDVDLRRQALVRDVSLPLSTSAAEELQVASVPANWSWSSF